MPAFLDGDEPVFYPYGPPCAKGGERADISQHVAPTSVASIIPSDTGKGSIVNMFAVKQTFPGDPLIILHLWFMIAPHSCDNLNTRASQSFACIY